MTATGRDATPWPARSAAALRRQLAGIKDRRVRCSHRLTMKNAATMISATHAATSIRIR
jgi:hypothetical protein